MLLHELDYHDKLLKARTRSEWLQRRLVQFENKFFILTAPASIVAPVIGQNVIQTSHLLREQTNQGSAPAVDPKSATVSLGEYYVYPVERQQKR